MSPSGGNAELLKLGRYEVVRELGKGAMGIVYLAKDPLIGRLVALKTIRLADTADDEEAREFQERFIREAQAAGSLSHPSIVTVHDIGQDPDSNYSYIAMEYVEGRNLKEVLSSGDPLPYNEAAEIVAQVAEALDYAHARGIVHRDVKPANIILCETRAKITDFGIAKIASAVSNLTSTGQFLGTPNYMAPEQVKGTRVDGRTDIFSLGIVLYEALSRKKPFGGDSLTTISYRIVHEPFQRLTEVDPNIPAGFEAIVARCLSKDPAVRYQRGRELAEDLRRVLRGGVPAVAPEPDTDTIVFANGGRDATIVDSPHPGAGVATGPSAASTGSGRIRTPAWTKRRISALVFFGVIAAVLIPLSAIAFSIWQGQVDVPPVDVKREQEIANIKRVQDEGEAYIRRKNMEGAYEKYRELVALAPNSKAIRDRFLKIEEARLLQMSQREKLDQAQVSLQEGKDLFDKEEYEAAIPLFEEAFRLDPNLTEATTYLGFIEKALRLRKMGRQASGSPRTEPGQTQTQAGSLPAGQTATMRIVFNNPTNDVGYVQIKVNGQTIVHVNLYTGGTGRFSRRTARPLNVIREIPAGLINVETAVVIRGLGMTNETRSLSTTVSPGSQATLTMTLNQRARRIDYQLTP